MGFLCKFAPHQKSKARHAALFPLPPQLGCMGRQATESPLPHMNAPETDTRSCMGGRLPRILSVQSFSAEVKKGDPQQIRAITKTFPSRSKIRRMAQRKRQQMFTCELTSYDSEREAICCAFILCPTPGLGTEACTFRFLYPLQVAHP